MREGYALSGRYKIVRSLGEGGMANVYLAHDLILNRDVAVKLLRLDLRDDQAAIRRFRREANSLTELVNPYIVNIYDVDEDNGMQYLVMEYVDGTDLKEYIARNHPMPYARIIEIFLQILSAVDEAHAHGIIHRDLKPQNILMDKNGNVKVTDFGIAVAAAEETMTRTNTLMGSVHYISPEQARGSIITRQSDIYSLGIVLFEMLTGHVPYEGETAVSIALKHYQNEMPSVRKYDKKIPQALENVVLHATAKNLNDRYQNVAEMERDLKTSLSSNRINEPKWHPAIVVDGETKVLPTLDKSVTEQEESDQVKELESEVSEVLGTSVKPKWWSFLLKGKHKWFLFSAILILFILVFCLMFRPKDVAVPDLRGMTRSEASRMLKDEKLSLGKVSYRYSEKFSYNQIITSNPEYGTKVKENTAVNVVVSKGLEKVKFGNYRGRSYNSVKKFLQKRGVTVYKETKYSNKYAKGEIIDQSIPSKEKIVLSQATVSFTVSLGAKNIMVRDLRGYSLKEVQDYAEESSLNLIIKRIDSDEPVNTVIAQYPIANTYVGRGSNLTVSISTGKKEESSASSSSSSFSSSSSSSSSSNEQEDRGLNFTKSISIPYKGEDGHPVIVSVYVADKNHNFNKVYKTMPISADASETVNFSVDSGQVGKYKVVAADGTVLVEDDNVTP